MALRGRVGRHIRSAGKQCQNWSDDQKTVIDLLNRIPVADGGSGGSLTGPVVNGISSDALFSAISRFEDKYFPNQRRGFVDPGGALLNRMGGLAKGTVTAPKPTPVASSPPVEIPLYTLRRNLLDASRWSGMNAGQMVAFDPLINRAVKHVDDLIGQGFTKLAWRVELLGRAFITKGKRPERDLGSGTIQWADIATGEEENPLKLRNIFGGRSDARPLPEMSYFQPVHPTMDITTGKLPALLLFDESYGSACARILPYRNGPIDGIGNYLKTPNNVGLRMPAMAYSLGDLAEQIDTDNYLITQETMRINEETKRIKQETERINRGTAP